DLRERVRDLAQHPGEARVLGLEADGCAFDPLADRMRLVVSAFERPGDVVGNRLEHLAGFVVELRGGGKLGVQALEVSLELFSRHGRSLKSRSPCGLCAYPTTRSGSANGHEGRAAWRRPAQAAGVTRDRIPARVRRDGADRRADGPLRPRAARAFDHGAAAERAD